MKVINLNYKNNEAEINNELEKNSSSVSVFPIHEYWLDIGQIEDYQKAQVDFISNFSNE